MLDEAYEFPCELCIQKLSHKTDGNPEDVPLWPPRKSSTIMGTVGEREETDRWCERPSGLGGKLGEPEAKGGSERPYSMLIVQIN